MTLEFLVWLPGLLFGLYSGFELWYTMRQHDLLNSFLHRSLARMQVEGRLPAGEEAALRADLDRAGCKTVTLTGPMESAGDPRVLRPADVSLQIECEPKIRPLSIGRVLHVPSPSGLVLRVGGRIVSERVDP